MASSIRARGESQQINDASQYQCSHSRRQQRQVPQACHRNLMGTCIEADPQEAKEALLFEKRSKNFCKLRYALNVTHTQSFKSFLVLFFKKELLPFASPERPGALLVAEPPVAPTGGEVVPNLLAHKVLRIAGECSGAIRRNHHRLRPRIETPAALSWSGTCRTQAHARAGPPACASHRD